jgi:hypothetical protein
MNDAAKKQGDLMEGYKSVRFGLFVIDLRGFELHFFAVWPISPALPSPLPFFLIPPRPSFDADEPRASSSWSVPRAPQPFR